MRSELMDLANRFILEARKKMMEDTKKESVDHMIKIVKKKMSLDNNDAMWIVHGFDFRNDYQNILKQNSVVFHKLLES